MIRAALILSAAFAFAFAAPVSAPAAQEDPPKVAGTDVPAPKRTRFVAPAYPEEAQARGQRGIVILELVVGEDGKVASADVIRSVPPFDAAAVAAARQWEYEVTKFDGRPVRVRVTVPITFALKLPEMTREEGVPEMRQGAIPGFPPGLDGPARVVADVTLMPDGAVADAVVRSGESPWAEGLLLAIRTWRFAPPPPGTQVAFTVQADFVAAGRPGQPPRVDLKLSAPQKTAAVEPTAAEPAAVEPAAVEPAATEPAVAEPAATQPVETQPAPAPAVSPAPEAAVSPDPAPLTVPPTTDPPETEPPAPAPSATPPPDAAPAPAPEPMTETVMPSVRATPAPPVEEIIPAPPTPAAPTPPPPQAGFSAVRDVTLGIGVPDLVKGRRPVVPPVARMASQGGQVHLGFAVDAAGVTTLRKIDGSEMLKEAAGQTVLSWTFRRTSAERIFLEAVFTYEGDTARAEVRQVQQ